MTTAKQIFDSLSDQEKKDLTEILKVAETTSRRSVEIRKVREILSFDQWIDSPYYAGPLSKDIYPFWKVQLKEFFDGLKPELILTGALGGGKTFAGIIVIIYFLYWLACFEVPQRVVGLSEVTSIILSYFSVSQSVAERTGFKLLRDLIDAIPFFQKEFKRNPDINSALYFPSNIQVVVASDSSALLSSNLICGVLDETNHLKSGGGHVGDLAKARSLYEDVSDRIRSRFAGKLSSEIDYFPGCTVLIGSATDDNSFVSERIRKSDLQETQIVIIKPWVVRPDRYSKKTFWVYIGSENTDPMVVNSLQDIETLLNVAYPDEIKVFKKAIVSADVDKDVIPQVIEKLRIRNLFIDPPEDFRPAFKKNVVKALQNQAGVATKLSGKFFTSYVTWKDCICDLIRHPFKQEVISISDKNNITLDSLFAPNIMFDLPEGEDYYGEKFKSIPWILRRHPEAVRHIGSDLSFTGDPTGLAMSHVSNWDIDEETGLSVPIFELDFAIRIEAPESPARIDWSKIRKFVFWLKSKGVQIGSWRNDSYQSLEFLNSLTSNGIPGVVNSVDRNSDDYDDVSSLMFERRFKFYDYFPWKSEWFQLEKIGGKVDHPSDNFKDVSDAVVQSITGCLKAIKEAESPVDSEYHFENKPMPVDIYNSEMNRRIRENPWLTQDYKKW